MLRWRGVCTRRRGSKVQTRNSSTYVLTEGLREDGWVREIILIRNRKVEL